MVDKKITELNNLTGANLSDADEFVVVDVSADETKAITAGQLKTVFILVSDLLGTVSQSGGVPTGSIIEQGSNANGVYVRFADGTQICTNQAFSTSATDDSTWTYPAAFDFPASPSRPVITGSISSVFGAASFLQIGGVSGPGGSATSITVNAVKYDGSRQSLAAGLLAVGRWF